VGTQLKFNLLFTAGYPASAAQIAKEASQLEELACKKKKNTKESDHFGVSRLFIFELHPHFISGASPSFLTLIRIVSIRVKQHSNKQTERLKAIDYKSKWLR
jgi:hypothetical protein